jgi:hypothetical protein
MDHQDLALCALEGAAAVLADAATDLSLAIALARSPALATEARVLATAIEASWRP